MANPIKGEVPFSVAEGDLAGDYVLLLDFNALCDLEPDMPGLMDGKVEVKSVRLIRSVMAAGLKDRHPDLDVRDAGRLIQAIGIEKAGQLVGEAFAASFGTDGGKGEARPPKGRASAGAGPAR